MFFSRESSREGSERFLHGPEDEEEGDCSLLFSSCFLSLQLTKDALNASFTLRRISSGPSSSSEKKTRRVTFVLQIMSSKNPSKSKGKKRGAWWKGKDKDVVLKQWWGEVGGGNKRMQMIELW